MSVAKFISIIVPVFNTEKYLHRCLDSILNQSVSDWECILVDDGSSDQSGKICDVYAEMDCRFRVFHTPNRGASSARNTGLDAALGEWISFIDSDDWVTPHYLQSFYEIRNKSDITFFAASQDYPNGDSQIRKPKRFVAANQSEIEDVFALLKHGPLGDILGWTWDKFYKADLLRNNNIRFVESLVYREDEIFIMEAGRYAQSVTILDCVLYHYCSRGEGLTASGIHLEDYKILSDKLVEILPYYQNQMLLKKDYQRVAEYKIKYALIKGRWFTSYKYVKWLYSYFKDCPYNFSYGLTYRIMSPRTIPAVIIALFLFVPVRMKEVRGI